MLHKMRIAMKRPGRDQSKLSGEIEVDESWLGGPAPGGKRGRGAEGKVIIVIAVERIGYGDKSRRWKLGRVRVEAIPNTTGDTLKDFVERNCEPGSIIYTDGFSSYRGLDQLGYRHEATAVSQSNEPAHVVLPAVDRVASLLKRWLLGTHHRRLSRSSWNFVTAVPVCVGQAVTRIAVSWVGDGAVVRPRSCSIATARVARSR